MGKHPSGQKEPERFYHGFVLGLLVDKAGSYMVKSNRESGYGRYDVVMEPKSTEDIAVIMEFKVFDREDGEETLFVRGNKYGMEDGRPSDKRELMQPLLRWLFVL